MRAKAKEEEELAQYTFKPKIKHYSMGRARNKAQTHESAPGEQREGVHAHAHAHAEYRSGSTDRTQPAAQPHELPRAPPQNTKHSAEQQRQPAHERLYAKRNANEDKLREERLRRMEKEVEGCTFAPQLAARRSLKHPHADGTVASDVGPPEQGSDVTRTYAKPRGTRAPGGGAGKAKAPAVDKHVVRMRAAKESRDRKLAAEASSHYNDESYKKSRKLAAKGAKPFHFATQKRNMEVSGEGVDCVN